MRREAVAVKTKKVAPGPMTSVQQVVSAYCGECNLTARERQVVLLICSGVKNAVIADRLGVSEATVRLHITNTHRKLGTGTKLDVVLRAFAWWLAREGNGDKRKGT